MIECIAGPSEGHPPIHPGAFLDSWLKKNRISQVSLARSLVDVSPHPIKVGSMHIKVNELIKERRSMTSEFAVLLSQVLSPGPKVWMLLQLNRDLWQAEKLYAE